MSRARAALFTLTLLGAVGIGAWALSGHVRDVRYATNFKRISARSPRTEVVALMGTPSRDGPCKADLVPGIPTQCAEEVVYSAALAPVDPQYYVVRLDRRGTVIESTWTASP